MHNISLHKSVELLWDQGLSMLNSNHRMFQKFAWDNTSRTRAQFEYKTLSEITDNRGGGELRLERCAYTMLEETNKQKSYTWKAADNWKRLQPVPDQYRKWHASRYVRELLNLIQDINLWKPPNKCDVKDEQTLRKSWFLQRELLVGVCIA